MLSYTENETKTNRLRCYTTIPFACSDTSQSNCDFRLSLNYNTNPAKDRVVVTQCSKNSNQNYVCNSKDRMFKPSSTWTTSDSELIWDIAVNLESKNKNFKNENYELVLQSQKTGQVSSVFDRLQLVNITV